MGERGLQVGRVECTTWCLVEPFRCEARQLVGQLVDPGNGKAADLARGDRIVAGRQLGPQRAAQFQRSG